MRSLALILDVAEIKMMAILKVKMARWQKSSRFEWNNILIKATEKILKVLTI